MIEFYGEIRLVHIVSVVTSGAIFLVRGLLLFTGLPGARAAAVRYFSYTIDTVLLTAALMLMTILQQFPFVHAWLTVKVLLLVVYIGLGVVAFRPQRSRAFRFGCWLAALAVYGFIVTVARAHHPLGFLSALSG